MSNDRPLVWSPPRVTGWFLYEAFARAQIKPIGRLTKGEYRRLTSGIDATDRLHIDVALRQSKLMPSIEEKAVFRGSDLNADA
jgi:hypothetical protein